MDKDDGKDDGYLQGLAHEAAEHGANPVAPIPLAAMGFVLILGRRSGNDDGDNSEQQTEANAYEEMLNAGKVFEKSHYFKVKGER